MSVTYGFYNSLNGDRKYNSIQMGSIFDGIIKDGVFSTVGDSFKVSATGSSMSVYVGTGRAWFNHTWTLNDALLPITVPAANALNPRIDTIVLDINLTNRTNSITLVSGTAASGPSAPTLIKITDDHYQYPICNIIVKAGVTAIGSSDIAMRVGTTDCPYVSGVLDKVQIDTLTRAWETEWQSRKVVQQQEFDDFMADLEATLDGDVAGNLMNRIVALEDGTQRTKVGGKCLGTQITTVQRAAIQRGTFTDMCIGDYWEYTDTWTGATIKWRIVDIDYWLNTGSTKCTTHHIVVMPDTPIGDPCYMCEQDIPVIYGNSELKAFHLDTSGAATISTSAGRCINRWIGNNTDILLTHQEVLINEITNGYPSNGSWYTSTVELPNEIMMYGCRIHAPMGNGTTVPFNNTNSRTQLALFRLLPQYIQPSDSSFWLRDIVSETSYAAVSDYGEATHCPVSTSIGIRPVFGITGGSSTVAIAEWAIGGDLSGKTIQCASTCYADWYDWAKETGVSPGGEDVYLTVNFANGTYIVIKDGCYNTDYDTVDVGADTIFQSESPSNSVPYTINIVSPTFPSNSVITSFVWKGAESSSEWSNDEYAIEWLKANIYIN